MLFQKSRCKFRNFITTTNNNLECETYKNSSMRYRKHHLFLSYMYYCSSIHRWYLQFKLSHEQCQQQHQNNERFVNSCQQTIIICISDNLESDNSDIMKFIESFNYAIDTAIENYENLPTYILNSGSSIKSFSMDNHGHDHNKHKHLVCLLVFLHFY